MEQDANIGDNTDFIGPSIPQEFISAAPLDESDLYKVGVTLRGREIQDISFGRQSYNDVLYANHTPCGHLYEILKPKIQERKQINNVVHSKSFRRFKQCVQVNAKYYEMRQKAVDMIKASKIQGL
jgi:hypothetical protein